MKITVAIDSFKGSITSSEAGNAEDYIQEKNDKRGILL